MVSSSASLVTHTLCVSRVRILHTHVLSDFSLHVSYFCGVANSTWRFEFPSAAASLQKYDGFARADLASCSVAEPSRGLILSSAFGWIPKARRGRLCCVGTPRCVFLPRRAPFIFALPAAGWKAQRKAELENRGQAPWPSP